MNKIKRLIWVFATACLMGVIAISFFNYQQKATIGAKSRIYAYMGETAEARGRVFHSMMKDRVSNLEILAQWIGQYEDSLAGGSDGRHNLQTLLKFIKEKGSYGNVWYAKPDGTAYSAEGKNGDNIETIAGKENWGKLMSGYVGADSVKKRATGQRIYLIWAPVVRNGRMLGSLVAGLNMELFRSALEKSDLSSFRKNANEAAFICDGTGTIILSTENGKNRKSFNSRHFMGETNIFEVLKHSDCSKEDYSQLLSNLNMGYTGQLVFWSDKTERKLFYQPLGLNDWMIFIVSGNASIWDSFHSLTRDGYILDLIIIAASFVFITIIILFGRKQKAEIYYDATHDRLTGLYNRNEFMKKAVEVLKGAEQGQYVLLCVDVENFKVINDQFGHQEGDSLLKYIANLCDEFSKNNKGIVCRDIADVFILLLPNTSECPEEFQKYMAELLAQYDITFRLKVRIGVYFINDTELNINSMIDRGMLAQRSVKGLSNIHMAYYDDSMRIGILREQSIVEDMEKALKEEQFKIYLQAQRDIETEKIVSAEALVRWEHPRKGLILPSEFIPIFEKNGFIVRLDEYIWDVVGSTIKSWKDSKIPTIPIAVNISRYDIFETDLCARIQDIVDKYGLNKSDIRLEITEGSFDSLTPKIIDTVIRLRKMGYFVSMDDFGSGYSSFNSLKDIRLDQLKMDMHFLSSFDNEHNVGRSKIIISTIMKMAKKLNLQTVAEGVETKSQAEYLKKVGCRIVQGYLYGHPIPIDSFAKDSLESNNS